MKKQLSLFAAAFVLGVISTSPLAAAENTWKNGSGNFIWDTTSANWTSPLSWAHGDNATFGATGVGTINLSEDITAGNLTFNASYSINANTRYFTNDSASGNSIITAAAGTSNNLALSMWGTNSLTFQGLGTTVLLGDPTVNDANHSTGGAYIRSGTVVLQAAGATSGSTPGSSHALDSVLALDAGATLVIPGTWNGSSGASSLRDQIGSSVPGSKLVMTGGTLDLYNDQKNQRIPVPQGTGLIINSGPNIQSGVQAIIGSEDVTFSGVIADGNNGVLSTNNNLNGGPGYQIGILQINNGAGGSGGVWTLTGPNTFSGSSRIDNGPGGIRLAGNGTLGFPTINGLTGPLRIQANAFLDLNGRNQTLALMQDGVSSARIFNSAVGTVSTLTIGYGNELATRTCSYQLMDNPGTGGVLALKKIITAPYVHWTGPLVTNCAQTLTGICTYSGDTTVDGGSLILGAAQSVSPSSAYRLSTNNYALLKLSYTGTANARQLWVNGVQKTNGVYGAGTAGIDPSSTGTLTVTGYTAQTTLGVSRSGNTLSLTWTGSARLQSQTNSLTGAWYDYPGGSLSPVNVTINQSNGSVYYRLAQ